MIVFDLACPGGHVFEAWFGSTGDYESQRERGLVSCPVCGAAEVDKAVMAPRVASKSNQRSLPAPATSSVPASIPSPVASTPPAEAVVEMKRMLHALAEAQARVLAKSDYVGPRFADEARAIHHGEAEERPIHGQATPDQARSLLDEGIDIAPLPLPIRPPGVDH